MPPARRPQISERYRKKVELAVRKPERGEEPPQPLAPCVFCSLPGPAGDLRCVSCQGVVPMDAATGEGARPGDLGCGTHGQGQGRG
jgi:WD repeat-containing protein 19